MGTFLVNGMTAHVLFYSGSTQSFVSPMLKKKLSNALGTLDFHLEVEITDNRSVSASRVHRGCVLNMLSEKYLRDFVSIPLQGSKVIVRVD